MTDSGNSRRAIERAMARRMGMSAEGRAALAAHNAKKTDWWGRCRVCGTVRRGALIELGKPCPVCHPPEDADGAEDQQ